MAKGEDKKRTDEHIFRNKIFYFVLFISCAVFTCSSSCDLNIQQIWHKNWINCRSLTSDAPDGRFSIERISKLSYTSWYTVMSDSVWCNNSNSSCIFPISNLKSNDWLKKGVRKFVLHLFFYLIYLILHLLFFCVRAYVVRNDILPMHTNRKKP